MMINTRELRIGNLLSFSGKYMAVSGIDPHSKGIYLDGDDNKFSMESPAPIPLTPEWLERCGFVSTLSGDDFHSAIIWDDPKSDYHYCEAGYFIDNRGYYGHYCDIGDIKYLHQLQNLYFALTGEELTIKETV